MKVSKLLSFALIASVIVSCNSKSNSINKSLETEIDSASYGLGLSLGKQYRINFKEVNKDLFLKGFINGVDSINYLIKDKDLRPFLSNFILKKRNAEKAKKQKLIEKKALVKYSNVKEEGEKFLKENKTKKGVITTKSGLQYLVIKEGKGNYPVGPDRVKVHYHGTLIDGTVFDSSVEKKQPITHPASGFVKGFSEGLFLMKPGAKYKFFIPQELAYGANPGSPKIKPFSTLIFEVELLEIVK